MSNEPNSLIIGGTHDRTRIFAEPNQHQVVHSGVRYNRVCSWMLGGQCVFTPATMSFADLMELLIRNYEKILTNDKP
jgi:hypothetical protein